MKASIILKTSNVILLSILLSLVFNTTNAQILNPDPADVNKPETVVPVDIYWKVMAYRPEASMLHLKAIDKTGLKHDVKAIQNSDDTSVLNVKAFIKGKRLPIKLIIKGDDRYHPAKAIDENGILIDIKAVTGDGQILDVKGVGRSGNIIHLRAISKDDDFYKIFALSPEGKVNAVKGVKMLDTIVETVINGVSIFGHVKALSQ